MDIEPRRARLEGSPLRFPETFRMVPDRLTFDSRIRDSDIRLWCILAFTARGRDATDVTDDALAEIWGVSPQTVRRSLLRLEEFRFIVRTRQGEGRTITLHPEGDGSTIPALELRVIG